MSSKVSFKGTGIKYRAVIDSSEQRHVLIMQQRETLPSIFKTLKSSLKAMDRLIKTTLVTANTKKPKKAANKSDVQKTHSPQIPFYLNIFCLISILTKVELFLT